MKLMTVVTLLKLIRSALICTSGLTRFTYSNTTEVSRTTKTHTVPSAREPTTTTHSSLLCAGTHDGQSIHSTIRARTQDPHSINRIIWAGTHDRHSTHTVLCAGNYNNVQSANNIRERTRTVLAPSYVC